MPGRVRPHVLERVGLGFAFEALEERHVAGQVRHVLAGDAAAAVHARKIVDAVAAPAADALGNQLARAQHARHLFIGAFQYAAARVADDGVERIAEAIGGGG